MMTINVNWDLESIFAGGSDSVELTDFLEQLSADFKAAEQAPLPPTLTNDTTAAWVDAIQTVYDLGERLQHAHSFIGCLSSQNVKDEKARQLEGRTGALSAQLGMLWTHLSANMAAQDDAAWEKLLTEPELAPVEFHLHEQRAQSREQMAAEKEALVTELATDGYHGWSRLYNFMAGDKQVEFDGKQMSLGQLQGQFMDSPNRTVRQQAFDLFEQAWGELAQTSAMALNHMAGFRLTWYKHRNWESFLKEPLEANRLTADTLFTMWDVIDRKSDKLLDYFAAKAKLFEIDELAWFDTWAPVGAVTREFTYDQAADFVVDNIGSINPSIAEFCRYAVDNRWVEAEDRPGKRAGAYCTRLPLKKEPRIFMTYNGSFNGMLTLAHELGHGYHGWVMRDLPIGAQRYTMSVAETASTLNELAVKDAALKVAADDQEKLSILGTSLNDATSFLMNIRARFEFEKSFYEKRREGQLSVQELSELMVSAQKLAYKDGLAQYHPLFWAS
ncbi:MAG: hypothetical protein KDE51_22030, partial [Anaerolineales bacterium]|nr:hypothetical protein [Anaerolineales bacterium]